MDCGFKSPPAFYGGLSTRFKRSTIRSAVFPSHSGETAPFFHCPAINRARPDRLFWSVLLGLVYLVSLVEQNSRVGRTSVMLRPPA